MASNGPPSDDISVIFQKLYELQANKSCFECGARNPTWYFLLSTALQNTGIWDSSFFRALDNTGHQMDLETNRSMQVGGNANAKKFFEKHRCNLDFREKYNRKDEQEARSTLWRIRLLLFFVGLGAMQGIVERFVGGHISRDFRGSGSRTFES
uniref:Uncharacterized protein n=1 Tax=Ditylenchus dipsaci TaxID=166011 RepID=A0A915EN60_9BILA